MDRPRPVCGICDGTKLRPRNTGPDALPICLYCDRAEPRSMWHDSDTDKGRWQKP